MNVIPKVSVVTVTYGQEDFIIETIKGVLGQRFEGSIEYIIVNDNSLDNTDEIIKNYLSRTAIPLNINVRYIRHEKNKGAIPNFFWGIQQARGKYVALCEGDDYWTDPHKLQKQVDFLENNPDYSICFHNVEEVDSNGKVLDIRHVISDSVEKTYTIEDLAEGNFIHTASVLFRRNFNELPSWFFTSPAGDYPLHIMNASYGLIKYFPEKMAAYRFGQGVWSSQTKQVQFVNTIFVIKLMMANLKLSNQVIKNFDNQISRLLLHLKDVVSPNIPQQSPENIAYNLSLKKLVIILLKKIRYSF